VIPKRSGVTKQGHIKRKKKKPPTAVSCESGYASPTASYRNLHVFRIGLASIDQTMQCQSILQTSAHIHWYFSNSRNNTVQKRLTCVNEIVEIDALCLFQRRTVGDLEFGRVELQSD
jgi:hypothetical protein